jgi:hypothetical protein
MTRSVSNTIDVRRRNFLCAHRTQGESKDQLLQGCGSNRALRFSAMRVGKSVGHAMMRGESAGESFLSIALRL